MELKTSAMRVNGWAAVALAGAVFVSAARSEDPVTLPMEISISSVSRLPEDRLTGTLRLQVNLESIAPALEQRGPARFHVRLGFEGPSALSESRGVDVSMPPGPPVTIWTHEMPLRWKASARRLTVRVDEDVTSARALSDVRLPRRPGEDATTGETVGSSGGAAQDAGGLLPVHGEIANAPATSWRPSDELVVLIGPGEVLDRLAATSRNPRLRVVVTAERNADPSLTQPVLRYDGPCESAGESLRALRSMIFCQEFGVPFSEVDLWRIRLPALHPIAGTLRLRVEVEEVWTHSWGTFVLPVAKAR